MDFNKKVIHAPDNKSVFDSFKVHPQASAIPKTGIPVLTS